MSGGGSAWPDIADPRRRADARGGDASVREKLAKGAPMTFETVVAECPQSRTNRKTLARSEHYWF